MQRVFEPFYRREPSRSRQTGGIGAAQLAWFDRVCAEAHAARRKVIVLAHHPVAPHNDHNVWNSPAVLASCTRNARPLSTRRSSGATRARASVSSSSRMAALPNTPTVAETLPGFQFGLWGGVFAPAGTPNDVVMQLNREINKVLAEPAAKQKIEDLGAIVRQTTPDEFADFVKRETAKFATLVKQIGIKPAACAILCQYPANHSGLC